MKRVGRASALAAAAFAMALVAGRHAVPRLARAVQPPPASLRLPVTRTHPAGLMPARFSHAAHGRTGCYQCHPSPFPQAAWAFTHDDMRAGRACGACHDGQRASAISAHKCEHCHAPR